MEEPRKSPLPSDLHPEFTPETLKSRSMRSIFALVLRHGALRVIGLAGNICLARLLVPEAFGIFATASFIIDFFKFFGDVGLGAALIQKEEVEEEDFRTTFTLQQMLIVTLAAICFLIAPTVSSHYELGRSGEWLLRVLSVSLFLSSLRSIPSIILQRQLHFEKLAFAEVLENISYWGLAVGLAALGYEVWSLVYATLGRHIVSLIVVYWMIPWRPSLGFHRSAAGRLLRFGAPYQLNGFLWMMQNAIAPIWVGTVCGSQALGFLTWAKQVAFLPLPFLNIVEKVTFPAFSRIQHDSERLGAYIEKCIRLVSIILFPLICLIVATSIDLIHFVYTDKWLTAQGVLCLYALSLLAVPPNTALINALYSLGKSSDVLKILMLSLGLRWILNIILVPKYGYQMEALIFLGINYATVTLPALLLKRYLKVNVLGNTIPPLLAAVGVSALLYGSLHRIVFNLPLLLLYWLINLLCYSAALWILDGQRLNSDLRSFYRVLRKQ